MLEQQEFFDTIKKEINNNHLAHAYLIETGSNKIDNKFINNLIKILLCPNSYKDNCDICKVCKLIDSGNYPDVEIIEADGSFIKKEQLIKLKDDFMKEATYGQRQVYVIKDAASLNSSSGNTILKFLEEPTSDIIALLFASNRYNVLDTIVSRCRVLSLKDSLKVDLLDDDILLMQSLFKKNKGFLCFKEIFDIIPNRNTAIDKFEKIEKYFFGLLNNKTIEYDLDVNKNNIYKILLILEKYLANMQYNINYKLMLDSFILEVSEVL